ncbi:STAS domain-containing protein [Methylobacter sp. S3L5C]|uniref:STAS domain-containing protein n=1 Tax=Methylobacter sp. S3L5C TaxID=2839024 RepID=UPI001FACC6FF|nr:STAS domain-containing protein [Methylobacter sp. S3L5C]UOA09141.1 STAS domain-containing protein [Methylobacter sp. S3L5C]
MILHEQKHNDIDIIELSGRFIMANTAEVRERLKALIDKGSGKLIIDMEKVTFIDSAACAVLISAFKNMKIKSGRLILVNSPIVQSLIELTRLHTIFEILPNLPASLSQLADK